MAGSRRRRPRATSVPSYICCRTLFQVISSTEATKGDVVASDVRPYRTDHMPRAPADRSLMMPGECRKTVFS